MAGYDDLCGEITAGYLKCGNAPSTPGIEPGLYVYNKDQFTEVYSVTNPGIVTGFTRLDPDFTMFKIEGFGDNFNASSKPVKKTVGTRFTELITAYIANNSTATKQLIYNGCVGRLGFVIVNNDKTTDSSFELYGAINGLQFTENTMRDAADEDLQGAWKIEAGEPSKLLEPLPPRSVLIPPTGQGNPPATFASTKAALEAFLVPAA